MPTYEYLCQSCGARFERFQRITEDPLTECPTCSGHVRRVLYPAGIVFKGSGFYKTDSTGASAAVTPPASSNGTGEKKASDAAKPAEAAEPAAKPTTGTEPTKASA